MGQFLLLLAGALVVGAIVFGVAVLITGDDPGLGSEEPDGRSVPLPAARPLVEEDIGGLRFDTAMRGYRMSQVDAALRRAAYDLGYKEELIEVLEAEVAALRDGRVDDADGLRRSRISALSGASLDLAGDPAAAGAGDDEVGTAKVPAAQLSAGHAGSGQPGSADTGAADAGAADAGSTDARATEARATEAGSTRAVAAREDAGQADAAGSGGAPAGPVETPPARADTDLPVDPTANPPSGDARSTGMR